MFLSMNQRVILEVRRYTEEEERQREAQEECERNIEQAQQALEGNELKILLG